MGIERKPTNDELLETFIQAVCRLKEACIVNPMANGVDRTEFRERATAVALLKQEIKNRMEDDENE